MQIHTFLKSATLTLLFAALIHTSANAADDKKEPSKDAPKKEKDPKDMSADEAEAAGLCPVCKKSSKPVYHYDLGGKTYHFFTRKCQTEFAANPEKYGAKK